MEQNYLEHCLQHMKSLLAIHSPSGYTQQVAAYLMDAFNAMGYTPVLTNKGGVVVDLGGADKQNAILLSAHVDTLGAMVSQVKPNGRLRVTPLGGINPNNTETENVTIITRTGKTYSGTYQLDNASIHVNDKYNDVRRDFDTMEVVIDQRTSSPEETAALGIRVGDIVAFDPRTVVTPSGYIKSRFLDDKLSAAILLSYAGYLKDNGITPQRAVHAHFTVYEEVGHGGTGSIPAGVTEILAVDMGCVGDGLTCDETMVSICAKDTAGPSNYGIVTRLMETAEAGGIPHAVDVYPRYGSDADAALKAGHDVKHALIGPGVYASHGYERSHVDGVKATFDLIAAYIQ